MNTGIDTIRKVVVIISGTLAIILMVFALCKKVGLCKEATIENYPMPYGSEIGWNENTPLLEDYSGFVNFVHSFGGTDVNYDLVLIYENSPNQVEVCNSNNITYTGTDLNNLVINFGPCYNISYENDTYRYRGTYTPNIDVVNGNNGWYIMNENGKYTTREATLSFYPIYISGTGSQAFNELFTEYIPSPPHSKGGVLAEITENDEIAETELPQIDTEAPTDTSSNPAWYQKILNAIGKVGLNIQSNTITTGNYLEQILTGQRNFFTDFLAVLGTHIGDITDRLDTIIGYDRENEASTLKEDWIAGYNNSDIKAITVTGQNLKTTLSNIGNTNTSNLVFGPWRLTYISGNLHLIGNYTMPEIFGGGTHQQDISFEWYENIRSWFVNIFKVFLFVGFAWYLVTQVPNMIHGTSGVFEKGRKEK